MENNIIDKNLIILDFEANNKQEVLKKASQLLLNNDIIISENQMIEDLNEREKEGATELEFGFAIPHAKSDNVKKARIVFIRLKKAIFWEESEVSNIFVLAIPKEEANTTHIKVLISISKRIMDDSFIKILNNSKTKEEVYNLLLG